MRCRLVAQAQASLRALWVVEERLRQLRMTISANCQPLLSDNKVEIEKSETVSFSILGIRMDSAVFGGPIISSANSPRDPRQKFNIELLKRAPMG